MKGLVGSGPCWFFDCPAVSIGEDVRGSVVGLCLLIRCCNAG